MTVSTGVLSGVAVAGEGGARDYLAFRGVPFAAPPVGDLRFKVLYPHPETWSRGRFPRSTTTTTLASCPQAPRPAAAWEGVRSAAEEASMCPQLDGGDVTQEVLGAEDCLYLNVYTPSVRTRNARLW